MSTTSLKQPSWTPTIRQVDAIVPGCRFHVASGTENFRVTQFGGELEFTQQIIDAILPGDVLFDIGGCIGFVAVHARKHGGNVVVFEPEPSFRARLRENLNLNDMSDVQVVDWAVSDRVGSAKLFSDGAHGNSPSLAAGSERAAIEIKTGTIDAAIASGELPLPHVIKLDIEGAEVRALRGMAQLLAGPSRPRSFFIEVHPPFIQEMGDEVTELHSILTGAGYRLDMEKGRFDQLHHIWHAR